MLTAILQLFHVLSKYYQIQKRRKNTTDLVVTQIIDLDQAQRPRRRLSVVLRDRQADGGLCSMTRYRLKSCSIDSLQVAVVLLVSHNFFSDHFIYRLTRP